MYATKVLHVDCVNAIVHTRDLYRGHYAADLSCQSWFFVENP